MQQRHVISLTQFHQDILSLSLCLTYSIFLTLCLQFKKLFRVGVVELELRALHLLHGVGSFVYLEINQ